MTYWNRTTEVEKFRELSKIIDQPLRSDAHISGHRARRLSKAQKAELVADYESGMLVRNIAVKFGIHRVTVSNLIEAAGHKLRSRGLNADQIKEASELYVAGQSLAKLSARYGVSAETVRQALIRAGVATRARQGWASTDL